MLSPIRNKEQYEAYLERAYELMQKDIKPESMESDELELISILIEKYENENFAIEAPNPIEAILFRLEQLEMNKSDLNQILGSRSRASEILNGKRKLSLSMIRSLTTKLNIPAEILIQDYELNHTR